MKICLVSSTLVGPTTNGGVGTAIYYLATEMERAGHEVTILFTGAIQVKNCEYWENKYKEMNITFEHLQKKYGKCGIAVEKNNWWQWRSYFVLQWFKDQDIEFDIIHFPETCGYAYYVIQAKRTLNWFANTQIVVTMHSSTEWLNQGMEEWPYEIGEKDRKNLLFLKVNYAERYSCQYCDYLLAPSQAIITWALNKGWKLCEKRKVLFNPYSSAAYKTSILDVNSKHFVFFGRLEKLKGVDIFCQALDKYMSNKTDEEKAEYEVSFLGRESTIDGEKASSYIERTLKGKIDYHIITNYNTFEALEYIKQTKGIVVLCSYLDNSPYSIVECITNSVPFICSNRGGIPELVDEQVLFEPTVEGILTKIENIENINFLELKHPYEKREANKKIVEFHEQLLIEKSNDVELVEKNEEVPISICIAYKNHGLFINDLIESIADNKYNNYEIIIANAMSDDCKSIDILEHIQEEYPDVKIEIIHANSKFKGAALNACVKVARGRFCIFVDAESVVTKDFIKKYVYAVCKNKLEAASSFAKQIKGIGRPTVLNTYNNLHQIPLGGAMEVNILDNCLMNTSFIVKTEVIEKLNGFKEVDFAGTEWDFMTRLISAGYSMDVVSDIIEYSRDVSSENRDYFPHEMGYKSHQMVLQTNYDECPSYIRHFITNWCIGRYENEQNEEPKLKATQSIPVKPETKTIERKVTVQDPQLLETVKELKREVELYKNSTFWKMTIPIQNIIDWFRKLFKRK